MAKANKLDSLRKRAKLQGKADPYYARLSEDLFVGFRKTKKGSECWVGRVRLDKKQHHQTFKDAVEYDDAVKLVETWAEGLKESLLRSEFDLDESNKTVKDAIDEYIKELAARKNEETACSTQTRLYAAIPDRLLNRRLEDLKASSIQGWLRGLATVPNKQGKIRTKSTANRIYNNFKAAMNTAYRLGWVDDKPWDKVQAFKKADNVRDLFLTDGEVQRLLDVTVGGLHSLVRASVLTGARYGELAQARVKDFSPVESTLRVSGKTGSRTVWLSDETTSFFKHKTASKLPDAYLLIQDNGKPWGKSNYERDLRVACSKAHLPSDTVLYSLRHYHISKALLAGVRPQVVAENCGTSIRMIEKHYGKFLAKDRRDMMNSVQLGGQIACKVKG